MKQFQIVLNFVGNETSCNIVFKFLLKTMIALRVDLFKYLFDKYATENTIVSVLTVSLFCLSGGRTPDLTALDQRATPPIHVF